MREIPLTKGFVALVDDEDYERLAQFSWQAHVGAWNVYAERSERRTYQAPRGHVSMHRAILDVGKGVVVDHINRNGLDNRRANLRIATTRQNAFNSALHRDSSSGFKGVSLDRTRGGKWRATIKADGRHYALGRFDTALEAARVYDMAALKLHGEFARINGVS